MKSYNGKKNLSGKKKTPAKLPNSHLHRYNISHHDTQFQLLWPYRSGQVANSKALD